MDDGRNGERIQGMDEGQILSQQEKHLLLTASCNHQSLAFLSSHSLAFLPWHHTAEGMIVMKGYRLDGNGEERGIRRTEAGRGCGV